MPLSDRDLRALDRLVARYNHAWDTGDSVSWAATFMPDGVFSGLHGTYVGRDELERYCESATRGRPAGFEPLARQHWVSNVLFDGDGDTAIGRCYLAMVARGTDGFGVIDRVGWYDDACAHVGAQWLFRSRRVTESACWPLES